MAKRLGYPVLEMRLSIIHGTCTHGGDLWSEWHDVAIAWGGVLAQFVVAGAMFLLSIIPGLDIAPAIAPIFAFLGPISIFIALFNLIPIPPLDGAKAWRIVPLLFERWRPGRRMKSRKRSPFGPVK